MMKDLKDFIDVFVCFDLKKYTNSCLENHYDEKILQEIKHVVNESIQYHNFMIGDYSRYPGIFVEEYLILIVEHMVKENVQAVIKGTLSYTAYLFPISTKYDVFSIDLYKHGKGLDFIIITEAINTISRDYFAKSVIENRNLTPVSIEKIRFLNEKRLPVIKPLGRKQLNNLLDSFKRGLQHKDCGVNRIDIYLIGSNVDQFFYVYTPPSGEKHLYKYNLLEGWLTEVNELSCATQESKGIIHEYIMSKLIKPQYTLECNVQPYVESVIEKFEPLSDEVVNAIPKEFIEQFAQMYGVTNEEMKNAYKHGNIDNIAKSALNRETPFADFLNIIKKSFGDKQQD